MPPYRFAGVLDRFRVPLDIGVADTDAVASEQFRVRQVGSRFNGRSVGPFA